jgi:hypothetical protein
VIVHAWDRDEPDQAGALRVETIEIRTRAANQSEAAQATNGPDGVTEERARNTARLVPPSPGTKAVTFVATREGRVRPVMDSPRWVAVFPGAARPNTYRLFTTPPHPQA